MSQKQLFMELYLQLSEISGGSLGYGFSQTMGKPKLYTEPTIKAKPGEDRRGEAWKAVITP